MNFSLGWILWWPVPNETSHKYAKIHQHRRFHSDVIDISEKILEFHASVIVQVQHASTAVPSQKWFIVRCFWGTSTKLCAAPPLSHESRSEIGAVNLCGSGCRCVCRCVCSVSAQHIPWGPQCLWTAKCHTNTLISLKDGLKEWNSCCTFAPHLDLPWLWKAALILQLNFVVSYFKVIFHALGYLFFMSVSNAWGSSQYLATFVRLAWSIFKFHFQNYMGHCETMQGICMDCPLVQITALWTSADWYVAILGGRLNKQRLTCTWAVGYNKWKNIWYSKRV